MNPCEFESSFCTAGSSMHPGGLRLTNRAARLAGLREGELVADIGCGTGATASFLESNYKVKVIGFDISEKLIEIGLRHHPGLNMIRWDCRDFPLAEYSVDAVIMEFSHSVLGSTERTLQGCFNALKPAGSLLFSDIYAKDFLDFPDHIRTMDEYREVLVKTGFSVEIAEDHTDALRAFYNGINEKCGGIANAGPLLNISGCSSPSGHLSTLGYLLIIGGKT